MAASDRRELDVSAPNNEHARTSREKPRESSYREKRVGGGLRGGRPGGGGRGGGDGRGVGGGGVGGGRRRVVEVDDAAGVVDPRASGGRRGGRAGELQWRYGGRGGGGGRVAGGRGEWVGGGAAAGADLVGGGGGRGGGEVDGLDPQDEHGGWARWAFVGWALSPFFSLEPGGGVQLKLFGVWARLINFAR